MFFTIMGAAYCVVTADVERAGQSVPVQPGDSVFMSRSSATHLSLAGGWGGQLSMGEAEIGRPGWKVQSGFFGFGVVRSGMAGLGRRGLGERF